MGKVEVSGDILDDGGLGSAIHPDPGNGPPEALLQGQCASWAKEEALTGLRGGGEVAEHARDLIWLSGEAGDNGEISVINIGIGDHVGEEVAPDALEDSPR